MLPDADTGANADDAAGAEGGACADAKACAGADAVTAGARAGAGAELLLLLCHRYCNVAYCGLAQVIQVFVTAEY
jgi:hypothetical protein